jgi:hypothetical protein
MSAQLSEVIETAAQLGALGLDPMRFLYTREELERNLMLEVGRRMFEKKQLMDHNLAIDIANQVGKLFK